MYFYDNSISYTSSKFHFEAQTGGSSDFTSQLFLFNSINLTYTYIRTMYVGDMFDYSFPNANSFVAVIINPVTGN